MGDRVQPGVAGGKMGGGRQVYEAENEEESKMGALERARGALGVLRLRWLRRVQRKGFVLTIREPSTAR